VDYFGAKGLFVAILVGLLSVRIYKLVVDSGVVVKMPDGVPPMIAASFTALIPYTVVFILAWGLRTLIGFDFTAWLFTLIEPLFKAADNIFMYTFATTLGNLFWAAGVHGDSMVGVITGPFTAMTVAANADAVAAGLPMPYIWTPQLQRMNVWTSTVWPLFIFLWFSKVPGHKTLFWTALPAGIFTIIEPIMFGLPLALNPILFIPFMLSTVIGSVVSYLAVMIGFVGRFFANLPWATPPFLLGPLASGDWKWIIIIALNVVIGYFIYLPFWRLYEKRELARIAAEKE
jgi:PTS system cellobiose-specific IIC component